METATKRPTKAGRAKEIARLTELEQALAQRLARDVWEDIGFDCIAAMRQPKREGGAGRDWMIRAEVVEVVIDADRYRDEIERAAGSAARRLAAKPDERLARELLALSHLRDWFSYHRPPGASYEAARDLLGRAFAEREGM